MSITAWLLVGAESLIEQLASGCCWPKAAARPMIDSEAGIDPKQTFEKDDSGFGGATMIAKDMRVG